MRLLDKYLLAWLSAIYGIIIYSIAFAIEMWFIVGVNEAINNSIGLAFALSAIYFLIAILSIILMLALIIHSIICMTCWLIVMALLILPECGLVLYISIYKWGVDSRNGQIELGFYMIRAIFNITCLVCIQTLCTQWKSEKKISRYSTNLCNYKHRSRECSPFNSENQEIMTTINPVFKYTKTTDTPFLPTTEFDPKNLQQMVRRLDSQIITYSTQSLDRKYKLKKNNSIKDEIVLTPLDRTPFDYLETNSPRNQPSFQRRHFYYNFQRDSEFTLENNSASNSIKDIAL